MRHENINVGPPRCTKCGETMSEHWDFPDRCEGYFELNIKGGKMDSLRVTDDASKAVQKTPNRVSLDSMLAKIVSEEFIHPETLPSMTICVLGLRNGFVLVGKSTPADPDNYDEKLGEKFSKEDAIRQMWTLEAYLLREKMSEPVEGE